ncbi:MAG: SH3 domain-containing protein [Saprospiraceae bacterium]|nr:SH3 domain-containing protein [Saprospiraceae bacterium]
MKTYFWIIFISSTFCIACSSSDSSTNEQHTTERNVIEEKERRFIETTTNRLRIRNTPDLAGIELERLPIGTVVEYLNDSTKFKTEVTIQGKPERHSWLKIKAPSGEEGWVYGGLVRFLSKRENLKIVLLEKEQQAKQDAADQNNIPQFSRPQSNRKEVVNLDLQNAYKQKINKLNAKDIHATTKAVELYFQLFGQANEITCDAGYVLFETFYNQVFEYARQKNWSKYNHLSQEIQTYGITNMNLDETTISLQQNGFCFGVTRQKIILKKDIDFVLRRFYRYVSPAMRAYLDKTQEEIEKPHIQSDRLLVPTKILADHLVYWERFRLNYPNFVLNNLIEEKQNAYIKILLQGTRKTPAFNPSNKVITEDFKNTYEYIQTTYPNTLLGQSIIKYYKKLEANNLKNTPEILELRTEIEKNMFS